MDEYKRFIFSGILLISLGVVFNTILKDRIGSLGIVFIAIGGLFFIIGMAKKKGR
jgi:hypothetical protein